MDLFDLVKHLTINPPSIWKNRFITHLRIEFSRFMFLAGIKISNMDFRIRFNAHMKTWNNMELIRILHL